jgi:hypothetical protein
MIVRIEKKLSRVRVILKHNWLLERFEAWK